MRLVILGNAGSGKTTLARRLAAEYGAAVLPLDAIAFGDEAVRCPLDESAALLEAFVAEHDHWVVEGCYAELATWALEHADELVLLDPGTAVCQEHCRQRPWEPDKFPSPERQAEWLGALLEWVAGYEQRDDECGAASHRRVLEAFAGRKVCHRDPATYGRP